MANRIPGLALLFPGQGSQAAGMGKELAFNHIVARRTFEEADTALGYDLSKLCFEGPDDQLRLTEITQPAILTVSVAAARVLADVGIVPSFVAGHSLGEYSAHVVAGTLSFADAVRTVRNRGKYMQEAVPVGVGTMAAILALSVEKIHEACPARSASLPTSTPPGRLSSAAPRRPLNALPNFARRRAPSVPSCYRSAPHSIVR
jgi:[acyl-carrier-protein] S-malonyltransferase